MDMFASPGNKKISPILCPVPPLVSPKSGCFDLSHNGPQLYICQPPLDLDRQVVKPSVGSPPHHVLDDSPYVGFSFLVAPFTKDESAKKSSSQNRAFSRHVQQLHGGGHAPPPGGPFSPFCYPGSITEKRNFS